MSETKELITITASAVELYEGGGLTVLLDEIEKRALELVPDVTTTKGRDALRTNAATVTSYKTKLFQLGKDLTDEHRTKVQSINSVRNSMEERLNTLKDKVRKPLTDYEEIEKARVKKVELAIDRIKIMASAPIEHDSKEIAFQLKELQEIVVDDSFGDLETPAFIEKEKSIEKLTAQLETVKQREKDQKELTELREKQEKRDSEAQKKKGKKEQADRDKKIKADAVEKEKKRVAAEKETERIATANREADKVHRTATNNQAVDRLLETCTIDAEQAKQVITAIAKGHIPNVRITY